MTKVTSFSRRLIKRLSKDSFFVQIMQNIER